MLKSWKSSWASRQMKGVSQPLSNLPCCCLLRQRGTAMCVFCCFVRRNTGTPQLMFTSLATAWERTLLARPAGGSRASAELQVSACSLLPPTRDTSQNPATHSESPHYGSESPHLWDAAQSGQLGYYAPFTPYPKEQGCAKQGEKAW